MTWIRIVVAPLVAASVALSIPYARADEEASSDERALATALFKEARKLLEDGHVSEACRKFEESERLDAGGGTLLNLASCHEREGRIASAWTEFEDALAQARRDGRADRAEIAVTRMAAIEPRLAHVTVLVEPPSNREGLAITLDGTNLGRAAWGVALPIDPGRHSIEARAPHAKAWQTVFEVHADSEAHRVSVPVLDAEGPSSLSEPPAPPLLAPRLPAAESRVPLWRDAAMTSGLVIGLSGAIAGGYFGVRAIQINDQAADGCSGGHCSVGAALQSQHATSCADLSTASFLVGAASTTAGSSPASAAG